MPTIDRRVLEAVQCGTAPEHKLGVHNFYGIIVPARLLVLHDPSKVKYEATYLFERLVGPLAREGACRLLLTLTGKLYAGRRQWQDAVLAFSVACNHVDCTIIWFL